jgi:hypothetical protein
MAVRTTSAWKYTGLCWFETYIQLMGYEESQ